MGFSTCWKCKSQFWMPDDLERAARESRGDIPVHCAYGHAGYFTKKSDGELERDRLKQQIAQRDDEIAAQARALEYQRERTAMTERRLYATKGQVTKIKNRVGHGVCPCCTRSFANLARHMATKHTGFAKSDDGDAATVN